MSVSVLGFENFASQIGKLAHVTKSAKKNVTLWASRKARAPNKNRNTEQVFKVMSEKKHRLEEVMFFQKSDLGLRLLSSVPIKRRRKSGNHRRIEASPTYQALATGNLTSASNHLNKLSPSIDDQNFMQLRGHLRHASGFSHETSNCAILRSIK